MAPSAVARPNILRDPGYLFIAPLAATEPTNTVVGGVFTDTWPVAWLPLGATEDGSEHSYAVKADAITVAEFVDAIDNVVTSRDGHFAFNLASFGASNYRRALNGGVAALSATSGTGGTALYTVEPPDPANVVKCMVGWESLDNTARLICRQTLQTGEVKTAFKKAPDKALIPCSFALEVPSSGLKVFSYYMAGTTRA